MMGFEVDFGHKHAADLIPSEKFDEKQVGYQALTILLNEVPPCCPAPLLSHTNPNSSNMHSCMHSRASELERNVLSECGSRRSVGKEGCAACRTTNS